MRKFLFLLLFPIVTFADLNKQLNNFFDEIGASANVSSADIYNGQKAGYATGGGVTIRNRVINSKVASINLPKFDAGCGGIDLFAGGFSFINEEQLVNALKGIGSSAVGYAFLLGLETVSPQVANTIKQLQTWSNNVNNMNINSCEMASSMVGSIWPKNTLASQQICRSVGGTSGKFSDWASARHKCSQQGEYDQQIKHVEQNPQYKDLLSDQYNIAWEATQKQGLFAGDQELAEFFVSLMGTVVVRKEEGTVIERFPPKIKDEKFIDHLMRGGDLTLYGCSSKDGKCLIVREKQVHIPHDQSWVGRIKQILDSIRVKIIEDKELDSKEIELLTKSRIPLYKMVTTLAAYKKGFCPVDIHHLADAVAMDLLVQYLHEAVEIVREGAYQVRRGQMYAVEIDEYLESLKEVEGVIVRYEDRSSNLAQKDLQLQQRMQMIEEKIAMDIKI